MPSPRRISLALTAWGVALVVRTGLAWTHAAAQPGKRADWGSASVSADSRQLADWVARTGDHQGQSFFVIDKPSATMFVFDGNARLRASTPILLGAAVGDDSVEGIGSRPMAQILASERTTPAGRFVAEMGRNLQGEDVVWVDHAAAVSMHRVRTNNAQERRLERLSTPSVADNRISYGCINVPVAFFNTHVQAVFASSRTAVVYLLPETRSVQEQFRLPAPR